MHSLNKVNSIVKDGTVGKISRHLNKINRQCDEHLRLGISDFKTLGSVCLSSVDVHYLPEEWVVVLFTTGEKCLLLEGSRK